MLDLPGKSTTLKSIYGLIPVWNGNVIYNGKHVTNRGTRSNVLTSIEFLAPVFLRKYMKTPCWLS